MKGEDEVSAKEQLVLPFPAISEGEANVQDVNSAASEGRGAESQTAGKARPIPEDRRELALAIFAQCDPVALGCAILQNGDERGASVRLRGLEMFTEWAYGKEGAQEEPGPTRLIWDLPRRGERRDAASNVDSERAEGGER